uniref:Uncharacterized protein n=1 Tax=Photinus pyralis TaxID=7054 RepID=A0A1Y1K3M0_PHOPY
MTCEERSFGAGDECMVILKFGVGGCMGIFSEALSGAFWTKMILLCAFHRENNCKYCRHCMYIKTAPPVNPTATTTSFVQKGHAVKLLKIETSIHRDTYTSSSSKNHSKYFEFL